MNMNLDLSNKPLVSVIIPIYNTRDYDLIKCINSIINQSYKNIEIILVDDGSNISNKKIIANFSRKEKKVNVFHIKNSGVSNARNVGINNSNGDYIMFVDADDWIDENCIELCIDNLLSGHNDYDIIFFGYKKVFDSKKYKVDFFNKNMEFDLSNSNSEKTIYNMKILGSSCMKLYKRSIIYNLFDVDLKNGEDVFFNYCNIVNVKKLSYIYGVYYNYNIHDESAVRSNDEEIVGRYLHTFSKMKNDDNINLLSLKYSFMAIALLVLSLNYCFPKKSTYYKNKSKLIRLLNLDDFKEMFSNIKYIRLPFSRKICIYFCKYRLLFLVYFTCFIKHMHDR